MQKKSYKKIRCIDPKKNRVVWIPEHAVEDNCRSYGLIRQDIAKEDVIQNEIREDLEFSEEKKTLVLKNPEKGKKKTKNT